jgi:hypothetical protein
MAELSQRQITEVIALMESGKSQRDIQKITSVSRPTIRKIAASIGYQFPRTGIEITSPELKCDNCGTMFRRSPSRLDGYDKHFCSQVCRDEYHCGENHHSWKGDKAMSFSKWVSNQKQYKDWKEKVLQRDGYRCVISGIVADLEAHHVYQKAEDFSPEKAFEVDNGKTVTKKIHTRLHQLATEGITTTEHMEQVKGEWINGIIDKEIAQSRKKRKEEQKRKDEEAANLAADNAEKTETTEGQ